MSIDNAHSGGSGGIVAGWYADPASTDKMRYWDGSAWTDRTAPLSVPAAPQGAAPVAAPAHDVTQAVAASPVAAAAVAETVAAPAAQPVAPQPVAAPAVAQPVAAAAEPTTVLPPVVDSRPVAASPAAAAVAADDFGGGFVDSPTPAVAAPAPTVVAPAAAAAVGVAAVAAPAVAPVIAPAVATPVVTVTGESRPVDPALAKSARRVAGVFNILALLVLVLGIIGAAGIVAAGFLGSSTAQVGGLDGPIAGILGGVVVLIYTAVIWALWKLLALVAQYIALRAE